MNYEDSIKKTVNGKEMTVKNIILDSSKGREYLNSLYPSEFEYYACAFELIDDEGTRMEFFSLPIMPQNIQENKYSITNIQKTFGGIVVTNSNTFVPFDINISGNFGRKMRKIKHEKFEKAYSEGTVDGVTELDGITVTSLFSTDYKTGYGSLKILEDLFIRATQSQDNGKPYKLLFYNLSLNSQYLVEPMSFNISQSKEQNMIWNYSLQMKAVAPARYLISYKTRQSSLTELRDYNKKYVKMTEKSSLVNEMLKDVINGMTPVQSIMNQYGSYKAKFMESGYGILKKLTENPLGVINSLTENEKI